MTRLPILMAAAALLTACVATRPAPITATNPSSPDAPEGARFHRQTSLGADETTRKSAALLSAAKKEQTYWDDYGPVSGTPEDAPKSDSTPEMKHDHEHH